MSKSIYEEALLDLRMNDSMMVAGQHVLTREQYSNVFKALKQAQKQEKLLELYKHLSIIYEKLYTMEVSLLNLPSIYYEIEIVKIKQHIKELENGK